MTNPIILEYDLYLVFALAEQSELYHGLDRKEHHTLC